MGRRSLCTSKSKYTWESSAESLTGYCVFLAVVWFVQAGFAVLPVLEYRITMQRCWDLNNPDFAETTKRTVCIDLVQYGLVLFRETSSNGFGLVCGPGGSYNPPRGDLAGFCQKYSPSFAAFVICFAGAGLSTIALVLFAIHHSSNFIYLKVRRYEGPYANQYPPSVYRAPPYATEKFGRPVSGNYSDEYPQIETGNGVNLVNPNYGSSIAETRHPKRTPVPEVMTYKKYREDEKHGDPPAYMHSNGGPSYIGDSDDHKGSKHGRSRGKRRNRRRDKGSDYSYRESRVSESSRGRRADRPSDEEELSARYSSDDHDDRSRISRRQRQDTRRDESPDSDYYMTQDRHRPTSSRWK